MNNAFEFLLFYVTAAVVDVAVAIAMTVAVAVADVDVAMTVAVSLAAAIAAYPSQAKAIVVNQTSRPNNRRFEVILK